MLLSLANSDREQETLRYAIFKASGVSQTEAHRRYGFEGMNERAANVEKTIADVEENREAIGWQGFRTKLYFKLLEL